MPQRWDFATNSPERQTRSTLREPWNFLTNSPAKPETVEQDKSRVPWDLQSNATEERTGVLPHVPRHRPVDSPDDRIENDTTEPPPHAPEEIQSEGEYREGNPHQGSSDKPRESLSKRSTKSPSLSSFSSPTGSPNPRRVPVEDCNCACHDRNSAGILSEISYTKPRDQDVNVRAKRRVIAGEQRAAFGEIRARVGANKVSVMWCKPTRSARLLFTDFRSCEHVLHLYKEGNLTVDGQHCEAHGVHLMEDNGFMVILEKVPAWLNEQDILRPMTERRDVVHPDTITMHCDPDEDNSLFTDELCSAHRTVYMQLVNVGPITSWKDHTSLLIPGKQFNYYAQFLHEADATRAVEQLHNQPIPFCDNKRNLLSAKLVYTTRTRVTEQVYRVMADTLSHYAKSDWDFRGLRFMVDPARRSFRVLWLEGTVRKEVVQATKTLEQALAGTLAVWMNEQSGETTPLWLPEFETGVSNGYRADCVKEKFYEIEQDYMALIVADERRCELRVVCPPEHIHDAIADLADLMEKLEEDGQEKDGIENDVEPMGGEVDEHRAAVRETEDHRPLVCDEDEPRAIVRDDEEHKETEDGPL